MKQNLTCVILVLCVILAAVISGGVPAAAQAPAPRPQLAPLEQLLAPVALYPDALLAQVLTSATSPGQVTDMSKWLEQNRQLRGTELQDAAQQRGYDASFVALALFPDVLNMMASQIDWTTELGTAFLSDPKGVMASVQKLRARAKAAGNLQTTAQLSVGTETQGGQQIIVIQPANPQVVYVPVYNPQVIYYPPPPGAVLLGFGLGIAIGAAINNNAYYAPYGWGAWGIGWHSHSVVVRGGAWVVPGYGRYPYVRPLPVPYGGYRPRPYVYAPTTININKITVNNTRYQRGATPRPTPYAAVPRPPPTRPPATTLPAQRNANSSVGRAGSPAAAAAQRPAQSLTEANTNFGDRGYNQPSRSIKPSERAQIDSNAFTGYQNGRAERAAAQRGQASVGRNSGRASSAPRSK
jgi:hypothetical protein